MPSVMIQIHSIDELYKVIAENPGRIFIKFSSKTCAPCKRIEKQVYRWLDRLSQNCQCAFIDIDSCRDVYNFYKSKKMIPGVPTMFCYHKKTDISYVPDDIVVGANPTEIDIFFNKCMM